MRTRIHSFCQTILLTSTDKSFCNVCRRYFGHKRTIRPNARKLGQLFSERHNLTWQVFAKKLQSAQKGFMGEPIDVRPGKGGFYEYPAACICEAFPGAQKEMEAVVEAKAAANKARKKGQLIETTSADEADLEDEAAAEQGQDKLDLDVADESYYADDLELDRIAFR